MERWFWISDKPQPRFNSDELDHGVFQLTLPYTIRGWVYWVLALIFLAIGVLFYVSNLDTADAPAVSEAIALDHPDEPHELEQLGPGFEEGEKGAWLLLEGDIEEGVLARGRCVETKDGWNAETDAVDEGPVLIRPESGKPYHVRWTERTWGPEIAGDERSCPGNDWVIAAGSHVSLFVLDDGETLWLFSAGEGMNAPSEVTDREDGQRWAMTFAMFGCLILMLSTPTSLSQDLKRLRKCKEPRGLVKVIDGEPHEADLERVADSHDWILPPPESEVYLSDPWTSGPEEDLLPEHPQLIGTPVPATITFYSLAAIGFVTFTTWVSADLLARHGSTWHVIFGNILRIGIVVFTMIWAWFSYKRWKVIHNIRDTPTSSIRSIAVGPAEIMGQALPLPSGTLTAVIGEKKTKFAEGLLAYEWEEEEYVKSGKNSHWVTRSSHKEHSRFIVHDGTGGILVDPSTFKKKDWGPPLKVWEESRWRWTITAITTFDPIFCLGRVEKRDADDLEACPSDKSVQQSLLVMNGNKDIGMEVKFTRGTELGLMKRTRSTFELLIVPITMLVTAVIPFIW